MDNDIGTYPNDAREIAEGIWWLPQCLVTPVSGVVTHVHAAQYLIIGSERTLLWDTGFAPQWPDLTRCLDELLQGRPLDYIAPSHPEVIHCSNASRLLEKYPESRIVGDVRDYPFFWPEYADRLEEHPAGSELDLGGHRFEFVDAVIKDLPSSQWGYESSQQVLFVADGFAYSHQPPADDDDDHPTHSPGECTMLSSELPGEPGPEQIVWITKAALYWTRFVKMDTFLSEFERLLAEHPTRLVAPAHGAVINDINKTLWTIWDALRLAYSPEVGVATAGATLGQKS